MHIKKIIILVVFLLIPLTANAGDLIQSVNMQSPDFELTKRNSKNYALISWEQSEQVIMNVFICDLNGLIVKTIYKNVHGNPGKQEFKWDLRDDMNNLCPVGAYIPIIKLRSQRGSSDIYNPSAFVWGKKIMVDDWSYDNKSKKITYTIPQLALCLMRAGEADGGPIYSTIFGWEPKSAGTHQVSWNGKDSQNLFDLYKKEKFMINIDVLTLPENSIVIKKSKNKSHLFPGIKKRFVFHPPSSIDINLHALHSRKTCHELSVSVKLSGKYKQKAGLPIINSKTKIIINKTTPAGFKEITQERFEKYVFIDGKLLSEGGQDEFPEAIAIDTKDIQNGKHILTINSRASEDHIGTYSMLVWIQN